jgi:ubiquinone biosynthesis protein COQ4
MKKYFVPYNLSLPQRAFLVNYYAWGSLMDPKRGDLVAGLGDTTSPIALQAIHKQMMSNPGGRKLLKTKPLISEDTLKQYDLANLPHDSFGKAYVQFMGEHGFSADERSPVRYISDPELAYVLVRYRQVHDFWHVLCGLPPTILGEVALKWFEFHVTNLPVCLISGTFGPLKLGFREQATLVRTYIPWSIRAAGNCADLMSYDYESNLHRPLHEVRTELNIEAAPKV